MVYRPETVTYERNGREYVWHAQPDWERVDEYLRAREHDEDFNFLAARYMGR